LATQIAPLIIFRWASQALEVLVLIMVLDSMQACKIK